MNNILNIFLLFHIFTIGLYAGEELVRYPFVAGQFYPAEASVLAKQISDFLKKAEQETKASAKKSFKALILPHAGYDYSGLTAALGYNKIKGDSIQTVVLIGPYHQAHFSGACLWPSGKWVTPLGVISINADMAKGIQQDNPLFKAPISYHETEHSLEVHVPFIQTLFPKAKLVPILISDPQYAKMLAKTLAKFVNKEKVLVIASTDMSHYHPKQEANQIDSDTFKSLEKAYKNANFTPLYEAIGHNDIELCGAAAVMTLLELSKLLKWGDLDIFAYHDSGETAGDNKSVVGYGASGIVSQKDENLNEIQRQNLLHMARQTLQDFLNTGKNVVFSVDDPALLLPRAVFVTLRDNLGNLRGCIGRFTAEEPLYKAVCHMAIEAATEDSRFSPVTRKELDQLRIEISILSPIQQVASVEDIHYGKNGVILSQGNRRGVFLPEVANSFPNKEAFLSELCSQKAGLNRQCWQNPKTTIEIFTTEEFGEEVKGSDTAK